MNSPKWILVLSSFVCLGVTAPRSAFALDGIVYMISGGPFDTGAQANDAYSSFLSKVQEQLPKADLYLARLHQSKQTQVCADIVDHKLAHPEARIVIAGHSYGSDAAVWTANCLQKKGIAVDFLLTLDTVSRPSSSSADSMTIPENVAFNFHFYQRNDSMIRGQGPNHRKDGSTRGLYGSRHNFGSGAVSAHLSVLRHLNDYNIAAKITALALVGMTESQAVSGIQPDLQHFFKDFPIQQRELF